MNNNSDFIIKDGVLIEYIGKNEDVVIPFGVTTIGNSAFKNAEIVSVLIPNSVTNIEEMAFENCFRLTQVTIPNSITDIEKQAFDGCISLESVYISDLTSWCNINFDVYRANPLLYAHDLYLNKELVKELVIPDSITVIKESVFEGGSFKEVIIPYNVTSIKDYAFNDCRSLESMIIPDNVKCICEGAFNGCSFLEKVVIKGNLEAIGLFVFDECNKLKEIIVGLEDTKKLLSEAIWFGAAVDYKIIVDDSLNKYKDIALGTDYLSDESVKSSNNKPNVIKDAQEKSDIVLEGDEL